VLSAVLFATTRPHDIEDARAFLSGHGVDVDAAAPLVGDRFMSAFICT
jgi:hypothetical protein